MSKKSNVYLFDTAQVRPTAAYTDTQALMRRAEALRAEEAARIFGGIARAIKGLFRKPTPAAADTGSEDRKIAA